VAEESSLSLEEMSSMTRQNAPNSKESAIATKGMDVQAEHLRVFIGDLVALVSESANGRGKRH
jgi:methyl-accepting chemotaxis protein